MEFDMFWALTRLGASTWGRRHWNGRAQESTETLQNKTCLDHVAKTANICNVLELIWNVNIKKRLAR